MRNFTVKRSLDGKRLIDAVCTTFPEVKPSVFLKALSKKDIRVNGEKVKSDITVHEGEKIAIYISDEALYSKAEIHEKTRSEKLDINVIYDDKNLIVVSKKPGMAVHPGETTTGLTLVESVRLKFNNPDINLCHRIDMNTGGIVLLAKNKNALDEISNAFKNGNIIKRYRCLVRGIPDTGSGVKCHDGVEMKEIRAFLEKTSGKADVYIHDHKRDGDLEIITRYKILNIFTSAGPEGESASELEVELVTGRTHQIRAHMAHIGHPVLGDGKYGRNSYNKFFKSKENKTGKLKTQQLFAVSVKFISFPASGVLSYLSGKSFSIKPEYDVYL